MRCFPIIRRIQILQYYLIDRNIVSVFNFPESWDSPAYNSPFLLSHRCHFQFQNWIRQVDLNDCILNQHHSITQLLHVRFIPDGKPRQRATLRQTPAMRINWWWNCHDAWSAHQKPACIHRTLVPLFTTMDNPSCICYIHQIKSLHNNVMWRSATPLTSSTDADGSGSFQINVQWCSSPSSDSRLGDDKFELYNISDICPYGNHDTSCNSFIWFILLMNWLWAWIARSSCAW